MKPTAVEETLKKLPKPTPNGTRVYIAGEDCPHCGMHQTWDGERCLYPECPSRHVRLSEVRSQALKSAGMRFAAQTAGGCPLIERSKRCKR